MVRVGAEGHGRATARCPGCDHDSPKGAVIDNDSLGGRNTGLNIAIIRSNDPRHPSGARCEMVRLLFTGATANVVRGSWGVTMWVETQCEPHRALSDLG